MTKLWHDDIRQPPDDTWVWARTNAQARFLLAGGEVETCSLDHDLGLDQKDPTAKDAWLGRGQSESTGLHLVEWMIENGLVPAMVTIHSWNPVGAKRMADHLRDNGHRVVIQPYVPPTDLNDSQKRFLSYLEEESK